MASESSDIINLPIATIQHDFQTVISDVRDGVVPFEDIWLSCFKTGSQSVHGKVRLELGERRENASGPRTVELVSRDDVHLEKAEKGNYIASCDALTIPPTPIRVPRYVVRDSEDNLKSKQINTISISPDLSQIAIGYENGSIRRLPLSVSPRSSSDSAEGPASPLTYSPHLSDTSVEAVSHFPSSRVLLSAGADFALHVLDVDPALTTPSKPVRTFKGHIRPVTGIAIIDRGRNVISGARDGTLRLWDVSSGKQIRMIGAQKYSPINALTLGVSPGSSADSEGPELDSREVGTADKRVFLALQSGDFECIDLGTKASVFHSSSMQNYQRHGQLTAIAFDSESSLLATGSTSGVVAMFDIRALNAPLCAFQRNSAGIEGLDFVPRRQSAEKEREEESSPGGEPDLAIATADGLPYIASIRPNGPEVRAELACCGDCEPLRALTVDVRGGVWLAGDEGVVRMY